MSIALVHRTYTNTVFKREELKMSYKYAIASGTDRQVDAMFSKEGAVKCSNPKDANLIVYLGGSDISPDIYNQHEHSTTWCNPKLDKREMEVYYDAVEKGKAQVGICRGGQLLHCLAGGWLYQDIDRHNKAHEVCVRIGNALKKVIVTSSHHQAMADIHCGDVLMFSNKLATFKETASSLGADEITDMYYDIDDDSIDIEAMVYPNHNSLSYQPHPEWSLPKQVGNSCKTLFFDFIEKCLEL